MPYGKDSGGKDYATCPCCGLTAYGTENIKKEFGYRNMGDRRNIPQSYCRKCRIAGCEAGQACKAKRG